MSTCSLQSLFTFFIILNLHFYPLLSEVISCNDSTCHQTEVSCTNDNSSCIINCNTADSCSGSTINCGNTALPCNVTCDAQNACRGNINPSTINCAPNGHCNIFCNEQNSCDSIIINCPTNANCSIYGTGVDSLIDSKIYCPDNNECNIQCHNTEACMNADIHGKSASNLILDCINDQNACKNIDILCPMSSNNIKYCHIIGDQGTIHDNIGFYAVNSWDDIDLMGYIGVNGFDSKSTMYCTEQLTTSCVISAQSWNCIDNTSVCYRNDQIMFPTSIPTEIPVDSDKIAWITVVSVIIGLFMFCLFALLVYLWCINKRRQYEALDTAADPDQDVFSKQQSHMYRKDINNDNNLDKDTDKQSNDLDNVNIATNSGLHIVREYSDALIHGGMITDKTPTKSIVDSHNVLLNKSITVPKSCQESHKIKSNDTDKNTDNDQEEKTIENEDKNIEQDKQIQPDNENNTDLKDTNVNNDNKTKNPQQDTDK